MSGVKLSERIYARAEKIWPRYLRHPFVTQMADGTLPPEKFRYYMLQDYLYLRDYVKIFAAIIQKADDFEQIRFLSGELANTIDETFRTHRPYMERLGITEEEIRRVVGEGRAVCAMTGGLNSGITALLAHRALGDRLQCIFVDTGLLRENEAAQVMRFYRDQMGLSIVNVQAQEHFTQALSGLVEPDDKRRAIGQTLQAVMDETLAGMGEFAVILRSTTCDDVLRGVNPASKPGLHAELPVVEPLRELFKDEVRRVGEYLNVPTEILSRQSFPSSGLALRILGDVTPARLQTLRAADLIFTEEIAAAGLNKRLWQYFALLGALPGEDTRVIIALRAMQSSDPAQLAHAARLPFDLLERVTDRIRRERPEVAHVLYDLNPSSRSTGAEW